jgi:hypothetical protein
MKSQRTIDLLAAACIVTAFGGLFFGRLMLYPVSTASGTFLERVAARADWWNTGHRWMLLGMLAAPGAAIAMRRAFRARAPWLCDVATVLIIGGAALGVGQYALDFAMLAAAGIEPAAAGEQFLEALRADAFVQLAFYRLTDAAQFGLILLAIALWYQGPAWRFPAILATIATGVSLAGPPFFGAMAVRVALGLWIIAFSTVALKIALPSRLSTEL